MALHPVRLLAAPFLLLALSGCAAVAVVDAAASVTATAVKTTAKAGGAVAGGAIDLVDGDGDDDRDADEAEDPRGD